MTLKNDGGQCVLLCTPTKSTQAGHVSEETAAVRRGVIDRVSNDINNNVGIDISARSAHPFHEVKGQ